MLVPLPDEVTERVEEYAREIGVDNDMLRVAQRYSHGSSVSRSSTSSAAATWRRGIRNTPTRCTRRARSTDAWEQCVFDPALARRWEALRDLPDGTLGREVAKFYDARGFAFPGEPGSAPPFLAQHDWVHVLADYGSTVECELEVFAFISRANDDPRAFSLLAMVISLFETGYLASGAGLFEYDRGHLSHEGMAVRLADAMRRGALCAAHAGGPDLLLRDWFADAHRAARRGARRARRRRQVGARDRVGSVTAWEPGGISPYQYDCGRKAAEAAGRVYDSYGALPELPRARSPSPRRQRSLVRCPHVRTPRRRRIRSRSASNSSRS